MKHPLFIPIVSGLVVALVAAVIFTPLGSAVTQNWFSDSDLQLVDADLDESQEAVKSREPKAHNVVKLDVTLRNTGETVAVIDHAVFHVKKVWHLHATAFPYPLRSTGTYNVRLSPEGAPYRKTKTISRKIPANDADKFTIAMDATTDVYDPNSPLHELTYVYLVNVDLVYDEDNKTVSTGNLLFHRGALWDGKFYLPRFYLPTVPLLEQEQVPQAEAEAAAQIFRARNILIAGKIRAKEGKKTEEVKKLVRSLLDENPDN